MSRTVWSLILAFPLALTGCTGGADDDSDGLTDAEDDDGDGLTNGEEAQLGLDPGVADTDGDGVDDGDEVDLGTDPLAADSDADGLEDGPEVDIGSDPLVVDTDEDTYSDFDEVETGHSPTDDKDRIYKGYWPYNADKDALGDPRFDGRRITPGEQFGRLASKDPNGDTVDLYDFSGWGKFVVIDASALWCGPCQAMASWLATGVGDYETSYSDVRKAVNKGDLYWVTVITDDDQSFDGTEPADVQQWDDSFRNKHIPVLTDPHSDVLMTINLEADGTSLVWPTFVVLDENMEVQMVGGSTEVLAFVSTVL